MLTMTQYLLFGGKGGVGKTTCAAATALSLANQGHKTLIVSTDPAHSLSDSFETKIGSKEKEISDNLFAVEINPKEAMAEMKEKLAQQEMPEINMPGLDLGDLTGGLGDLGSMPGMDEMTAFDKFLQYIDNPEYEYVVFDTAPTGHTLKFLSLPELMDSWVGKMLKMRIQMSNAMNMFKNLIPFTQHEEKDRSLDQLEEMKKRVEKGKLVLTNPELTELILVLIPQEMSISESERALESLNEFGVPVKKLVVNQIQPEKAGCSFCTERRKLHIKKTEEIHQRFKGKQIKEVELFDKEIIGKGKLKEFAERLS
jgi:arsenite-transporting ATPase